MDTIIDQEPERAEENRLTLRSPAVPATLNELAALKGEAVEIVEARALVLATLRTASIKATSPEDWLLFRSPEEQGGQIVGYLQDCGCDRVRDLYGIEIYDISQPQKVSGSTPEVFHYLISASGRCKLTRQVVETIEGGRSSTDDFCKGKSGVELELAVRKAARANLDGNITRELAGLKSVPVDELKAAWTGSSKKVENCRRGRGFGSASERLGATREGDPEVEPPTCPYCPQVNGAPVKLKFRAAKGDRKAFYGCPNFEKHAQQKIIVDAAEWASKQQLQQRAPASEPASATQPTSPPSSSSAPARPPAARGRQAPTSEPLTAGDIFGRTDRDPGEDG